MKRNLTQLASQPYELLVIGGGIYGACIARDAILRGLQVALVDEGDFGHATSANSLKTIHGGLRYLQDANLKLVRLMINERKAFMRVAPHLVHPLACLMPTYKQFLKSKFILRTALMVNDLAGFDRNWLPDPQKHLPGGRIISRQECLQLMPEVTEKHFTGGALWYDAQMYNSERLTLSFVLSAAQKGAAIANYVKVVGFLRNDQGIRGVNVKDLLTGEEFEIQAKMVVNAAGPWIDHVLNLVAPEPRPRQFYPSIAMNLVTRQIIPKYAFGIPSRYRFKEGRPIPLKEPRILFISPWRNYSLVGTVHLPITGCIDDYEVTDTEIQDFIEEINTACPGAVLEKKDIYFVHTGFLPAENKRVMNSVELVRQGQICDHQKAHGIGGLITVVGVKYTTARYVAGQVVELVFRKLGIASPPCLTHLTPIYGGQIDQLDDFLTQAVALYSKRTSPEIIHNLIYNYGSTYPQVLDCLDDDTIDTCQVTKAKVRYSVRQEMAQKLADVILRRADLGSAAWPGEACLQLCAETMATELGWDQSRKEQEINEVRTVYTLVN